MYSFTSNNLKTVAQEVPLTCIQLDVCIWLPYPYNCYTRILGISVQRQFQQYFSYIMAVNFIDGGNRSTRRKPPTCSKSLTNFTTYCCIEYTSLWAGFELATLVAIAIGHCKSNYHVIIAPTAPNCFCLRGKIQPFIEDQWTFSLDYDI